LNNTSLLHLQVCSQARFCNVPFTSTQSLYTELQIEFQIKCQKDVRIYVR
jgi:hypothetical protein